MGTSEQFWDKASKKYSKSQIKDMAAYDQTIEHTRKYLNQDDKVLEIGCGTATTALRLAKNVHHITASDISGDMLEIGKAKAKDQNVENISFIKSDALSNAATQTSFNCVLAFNLVHLLEDAPSAIRKIQNQLIPGGLFVSKTICMDEHFNPWPPLIFIMQKLGRAPYVKFYKVTELEAMIEAQGFEIIDTASYPLKPVSRFIVARKK